MAPTGTFCIICLLFPAPRDSSLSGLWGGPCALSAQQVQSRGEGSVGSREDVFPNLVFIFFLLSVGRAGIGATCVLKGGDLGDGMSSACAGLCVCGVCAHTHVQLCGRTSDTSPLCPPSWALPALPLVWNPKVCWWGGVNKIEDADHRSVVWFPWQPQNTVGEGRVGARERE